MYIFATNHRPRYLLLTFLVGKHDFLVSGIREKCFVSVCGRGREWWVDQLMNNVFFSCLFLLKSVTNSKLKLGDLAKVKDQKSISLHYDVRELHFNTFSLQASWNNSTICTIAACQL